MFVPATLAAALVLGAASAAPATTIWQPTAGCSWQISLSQVIDASQTLSPDVAAYDIDLFDNTATNIANFHSKGKKVICYFSAGTYENWRPDASSFQSADLGPNMADWPGEKWLKVSSANVRAIMTKRIQLAAQKGCDAIDPDNIDAYANADAAGVTQAQALDFVKFLIATAKQNNLAFALKNAMALIPSVVNDIQMAVNEQCEQYQECDQLQPLIKANKPVLHIEYPDGASSSSAVAQRACDSAASDDACTGFSTLVKNMSLDQWAKQCPVSNQQSYGSVSPSYGSGTTSAQPAASSTAAATSGTKGQKAGNGKNNGTQGQNSNGGKNKGKNGKKVGSTATSPKSTQGNPTKSNKSGVVVSPNGSDSTATTGNSGHKKHNKHHHTKPKSPKSCQNDDDDDDNSNDDGGDDDDNDDNDDN